MNQHKHRHQLLFVDDEPRITSAMKAIFRRDYDVLTANSGDEALEILAENDVNVIVSDQRMPKMLGNELLAKVSANYPRTMRILLTGFMDKQAIVNSINDGQIYRFINKPWNNDEVRSIVADAAIASAVGRASPPCGDHGYRRGRSAPVRAQMAASCAQRDDGAASQAIP